VWTKTPHPVLEAPHREGLAGIPAPLDTECFNESVMALWACPWGRTAIWDVTAVRIDLPRGERRQQKLLAKVLAEAERVGAVFLLVEDVAIRAGRG